MMWFLRVRKFHPMGDSGFGAETQGIWDFAPDTDCSIYGLGVLIFLELITET